MNTFADLTPHGYGCIFADPPWSFTTWSKKNQTRAAENHYAVMSLDEIKALPVADIAAPDCALFMWVINPMIPHALDVLKAWDFTFKTVAFCWAKTTKRSEPNNPRWHVGMGYSTRSNIEQCLLATRGKPKRLAADVRQLIVAPRREHSRKPDDTHERIERLFPGPYCELFARESRKNWTSWGIQRTKFDLPMETLE